MEPEDYVTANRNAWDDSAPHHRANATWQRLSEAFAAGGYSCLDVFDQATLGKIGLVGKDVAQICCNNGRELLSIRNLGARRCVGFDQSAAFLSQARELNALAELDCEFVETDIHAIDPAYNARFDLAVITIGVLAWMPDLTAFFSAVIRLLRPGGILYIYEEHPVMNMFDPKGAQPDVPATSYFQAEPRAETTALVYDGSAVAEVSTHYWFYHPLGKIVTSAIGAGLRLVSLEEFSHNVNIVEYDRYAVGSVKLPMSYQLLAVKPVAP